MPRSRAALVLLCWTSLVGCDGLRCSFEMALRDVPSDAIDCGTLELTATDAERLAARDCVLAAVEASQEFVVVAVVGSRTLADGREVLYRVAYYGTNEAGLHFVEHAYRTTSQSWDRYECATIEPQSPCLGTRDAMLCLSCTPRGNITSCDDCGECPM